MAAYEKQTWETGDTITAEKLNHIESGIYADRLAIKGFIVGNGGSITATKLDGTTSTLQPIPGATTSSAGLLSSGDKKKLDQITATNKNVVTGIKMASPDGTVYLVSVANDGTLSAVAEN